MTEFGKCEQFRIEMLDTILSQLITFDEHYPEQNPQKPILTTLYPIKSTKICAQSSKNTAIENSFDLSYFPK